MVSGAATHVALSPLGSIAMYGGQMTSLNRWMIADCGSVTWTAFRPTTDKESLMDELALLRRPDGTLDAYVWPGGYPIYYFDAENNTLCPICAAKEGYSSPVTHWDINWEDNDLTCDDCYKPIESAYADE
jgi:hypothetical protein